MFTDHSHLLRHNAPWLHYGVAVTDVDGDGQFELFVCGYGFPNRVLKWAGTSFIDIADRMLADTERQAIGVAAADIDSDGREEIYVVTADTFAGDKNFADRLWKATESGWQDLFASPRNLQAIN